MEAWRKQHRLVLPVLLLFVPLLIGVVNSARAIPAFSRKYQTSCTTCHYAFPQLNAFGKAFRNNGYRYPGGDENFRKEEPVSLGSEAYKQVWPDAIWPSDIPGTSPLAVHAIGQYEMKFHQPDSVARSVFEFPGAVEILYAGTLGDKFSFFGEVAVETEGGAVETGFPFRLELNQRPGFNVVLGSFVVDPTPGHRSLIPTEFNVSMLESRNGWMLHEEKPGLELWGAGNGSGGRGGWKYQAGVMEGQGGDAGRDKDVFAQVTYKVGGLGELGGTEGQASQTSAFYRDNSVTVGGFVSSGRVGADLFADKEDLTVVAGTLDAWYERAILNATAMSMNSRIGGTPDRKSLAWYAQGQYVIYPWLIGLARYESTDEDTDDAVDPQTTLIPAVAGMVRANVKLTLQYVRPISDYDARKADEERVVAKLDFSL
ncbi:MAG: hypothetical protein HZC42_03845 [Candidatus Eisenbacteria bacterium]|nr:hypothetical protein [Candidatus Eisenbacteria bacterium]